MDYNEFLVGLAVDLVAISVLTYALYFRRHQRRDLTLGLMGINIGLFAVSSFTATTSISIGFGIGLFALLSVIRLRSAVASQEEIGYYFVALVIGLVNGLAIGDSWNVALTLNVVLLAAMFVADHPRMLRHAQRQMVVMKGAPQAPDALAARLGRKLGYEVTRVRVLEVDFARKRMLLDVRFRTDRPVTPPAKSEPAAKPEPVAPTAPVVETDAVGGAESTDVAEEPPGQVGP